MTHSAPTGDLLGGELRRGPLVIEASAGTGKTYSLSALVARHVAETGLMPANLLVVTFTRAAAAELRDRTRRALVQARDACASGVVPADQPWLATLIAEEDERQVRFGRLAAAVASFDDATISTIHGFCQNALGQIGVRSGSTGSIRMSERPLADLVEEVCLDLVIDRLSDTPEALSWIAGGTKPYPATPSQVLALLRRAVSKVLQTPGVSVLPATGHLIGSSSQELVAWTHAVNHAVHLVRERRRSRLEFGYDDLVVGLRDALVHPAYGKDVKATLVERYRLVLIDESQDNDPLQWEIFTTAFGREMITVGDPKQAIYRFRGADVYAYLNQVEGVPVEPLSVNHRSDHALVEATNALLVGFRLGDERIEVREVTAADPDRPPALRSGAPLQLRWLPTCADLVGTKGAVTNDRAESVILADLTGVVSDLLGSTIVVDGEERPIHAGDIAVLVNSGFEADDVQRALAAVGVPAVRTRTGSVLRESAALHEWRTLLFALDRPSDAARVRAGGLGVFLELPVSQLDTRIRSAELDARQRRCVDWSAGLGRVPFLAWYDRIREESDLAVRLLQRPGGERLLTDLDHVAELLATELGPVRPTAALALRQLDHLVGLAGVKGEESDPEIRRIDSDARAVQISTIHTSKGLEYPIVLLPYSWKGRDEEEITVFNDDQGKRVIDVGAVFHWSAENVPFGDPGERRGRGLRALRGDQMRLLYVAMTRAKHRTIAWWAPAPTAATSALSAVLFDRDENLVPLNTFLETDPDAVVPVRLVSKADPDVVAIEAAITEQFERLARSGHGGISVHSVDPATSPTRVPVVADGAPTDLAVAVGRPVADPSWKRWSFTSITRHADDSGADRPVVGGADEPPTPKDGDDAETVGEVVTSAGSGPDMPWRDLEGGADVGTLVHDLLERVDPTSATLDTDIDRLVDAGLRRSGLQLDHGVVAAGVRAAMHTPLGPVFDELRLVDIARSDRLAELRFDLPLVAAGHAIDARAIGEVLLHTLESDDPVRAYASDLAAGRFRHRLAGFLQGSIDAVLRIGDIDDPRFVVIDYKTNRLHTPGDVDPLAAYHPVKLPSAMAHADYPLQAILYSVALHRYLRWRLVGYQPDRHLGGIGYLFLRGMVGPHTPRAADHPYGVFAWRPPAATIEALDHLFAVGGAS